MTDFTNVYGDDVRAASYDKLEFPGTYHLAYRDLPALIAGHATVGRALDFGCGTGRSTRFLGSLGYETMGVDVSRQMLARARERDPEGEYRLVPDGNLGDLPSGAFDLVFSSFTFDNIPTLELKVALFSDLRRVLSDRGRILNLVSSPEIYVNEWASFSTRDFPENRQARSGDRVKIVMLDVEDARPVEDIVWSPEDYARVYAAAGLTAIDLRKPLGRSDEPFPWVSETAIAPWTIYMLERTC